jgi:bifunctional DNase/RNase
VLEDHFGHVKYIDCRPSDAICLALKMDKPILAAEAVFEEIQQNYVDKVDVNSNLESNQELSNAETSQLKKMMKQAIENEDYELAASIQAELNKRLS